MAFRIPELFGLDVGASTVKAVHLKKASGAYRLIGAGLCPIRPGDNPEHQHLHTVEAIRECVAAAGLEPRSAVCAVSGPDVAVRTFDFPNLTDEEVEGAVALEASQVCPFDAQNAAIDHQVVAATPTRTRGVLAAATNGLVEARQRLVEEAGLRCGMIDIEGLALLNAFHLLVLHGKETPERPTAHAVLNLGTDHVTLAVASPEGIPFVRDLVLPGAAVQAQDPAASPGSWHGAMEPAWVEAMRPILDDVSKTIRFYLAQNPSLTIETVQVCGDLTASKGFVDLVKAGLHVPAAVWNPMEHVDCTLAQSGRDLAGKQGPAMALAVGLAMRTV